MESIINALPIIALLATGSLVGYAFADRMNKRRRLREPAGWVVEELYRESETGMCVALLSDDCGNWCIADAGFQPASEKPSTTTFFTEDAEVWKPTIEEAMEYYQSHK